MGLNLMKFISMLHLNRIFFACFLPGGAGGGPEENRKSWTNILPVEEYKIKSTSTHFNQQNTELTQNCGKKRNMMST